MTTDTQHSTPATVFLAHSSQDEETARRIRNLFEDRQHKVLLLALLQQMPEDYLREMLAREILARDWLVMLRSRNSEKSTWVNFEIEFAESHKKEVYEIVLSENIEQSDDAIYTSKRRRGIPSDATGASLLEQVISISRSIRIHITHAYRDQELTARLESGLRSVGYEVTGVDRGLISGEDQQRLVLSGLDGAIEKGAVLFLMNEDSLNSAWVQAQLNYVKEQGGRVLPCVTALPPDGAPDWLMRFHWLRLSNSYEEGLTEILAALKYIAAEHSRDAPI